MNNTVTVNSKEEGNLSRLLSQLRPGIWPLVRVKEQNKKGETFCSLRNWICTDTRRYQDYPILVDSAPSMSSGSGYRPGIITHPVSVCVVQPAANSLST
jgi:hypothetical protein